MSTPLIFSGGARPKLLSPPVLSAPSLAVGQTFTLSSGTFNDATALRSRILVDDVVKATGGLTASYVAIAGDEGKKFVGQQQARGQNGRWSPWYPSNFLIIPASVFLLNGEWEVREALVPGEASTPRRQITTVFTRDPPGGEVWSSSRSSSPAPTLPTPALVAPLTGSAGGPYVFVSGGQAPLNANGTPGAISYAKLTRGPPDESVLTWVSNELPWTASQVPEPFGSEPDDGSVQVLTGTAATGDVILRVSRMPRPNGQVITALEYDVGASGTWLAVGALTEGDYVKNFTELDPANPVQKTFRFRTLNANGYSPVSGDYTGTPKASVVVPTGPAPVLSNLAYNSGTNEITVDCSQPGQYFWLLEASSTTLSGAATKAAVLAGTPVAYGAPFNLVAGVNTITMNTAALATGTYYFKHTAQNGEGTFAVNQTPLSLDFISPVTLTMGQTMGFGPPSGSGTVSRGITLPATIPDGYTMFLIVWSNATQSGSMLPDWTLRSTITNGGTGNTLIFSKVAASAGGSAVTITAGNALDNLNAVYFDALLVDNFYETPATTTAASDPPALTLTNAAKEHIFIAVDIRQKTTGSFTAAPSGYSGLVTGISVAASGGSSHAKTALAWKKATVSSPEDPGTFTGTADVARLAATFAVR